MPETSETNPQDGGTGAWNRRGLGLLDVLIAAGILGVGLVATLGAISQDLRGTRAARYQLIGQSVARDLLEHYARYQGYDILNATQTPYTIAESSTNFSELARLPAGATATIFVDSWYPASEALTADLRGILQVRVTVSWTGPAGGIQSAHLVTFVAREGFDKT